MNNPAEPRAASSHAKSRWQTAYLRYREFERQFVDVRGFRVLLHDAARGEPVFERRLAEYQEARHGAKEGGLAEPSAELIRDLRKFAVLQSSYAPEAPGFVFEDVYHLAFNRLVRWRGYRVPIPLAQDCTWLYRGQRDDSWEIGAKIYRKLPEDSGREGELRERSAAACRVGHAVASKCSLSFEEGIAIAQHFSAVDELGASTWLADFSRDPWVGLFFASDNGKTGDCGIVWSISLNEWKHRTTGEGNPIGPLQLVVPPCVKRIDNQAGVFIIAAHPWFLEQYVPFGRETRFQQFTDLTFEDPMLGITRNTIYPSADPFLAMLPEIRATVANCGCALDARACDVPPPLFTDPVSPKTYQDLLTCWLNELQADRAHLPDPIKTRAALPELAQFHAVLQTPEYVARLTDKVSRSLNRLRDALVNLYVAEALDSNPISFEDAVRGSYFNQMTGDREHLAVLQEVLNKVVPRGDAFHR